MLLHTRAATHRLGSHLPRRAPAVLAMSSEQRHPGRGHPSPLMKRRKLTHGVVVPDVPAKAPTIAHASPGKSAPLQAPGDGTWMIVGLGNPGATYAMTRHNVGFWVVDALSSQEGIDVKKLEKGAAVGRGVLQGKNVILVKPVTFMNNSGEAVSALAHFYKIPTSRILVISDDLDLDNAVLRLRAKGGHGGHNGLRSISERMGNTQDFPRLKLGIGRPPGQLPVAAWVLQDFTKQEKAEMEVAVQQACDAIRSIMDKGLEKTVSVVHPPAPKPPPAAKKQATAAHMAKSNALATAVGSGPAPTLANPGTPKA
ncbi:peptidyl-tRNA hydrolase [Haematococcus lacustris]